ncbi:MAG: hypothetical protein WCP20_19960, partial [Desulfuromonadales bacterium]
MEQSDYFEDGRYRPITGTKGRDNKIIIDYLDDKNQTQETAPDAIKPHIRLIPINSRFLIRQETGSALYTRE